MKITVEAYESKYTFELGHDDQTEGDMEELLTKIMYVLGYDTDKVMNYEDAYEDFERDHEGGEEDSEGESWKGGARASSNGDDGGESQGQSSV